MLENFTLETVNVWVFTTIRNRKKKNVYILVEIVNVGGKYFALRFPRFSSGPGTEDRFPSIVGTGHHFLLGSRQ